MEILPPIDNPIDPNRPPSGALVVIHRFLRFVYTNNPFYAISAAFVLYGIHLLFNADDAEYNPWVLMSAIAAYCLLMAATACVIVRYGGVWDDARTILVILVLEMLCLSVSFDKVIIDDRGSGAWILATGLAFAVLLSEAVLRVLRVRLPLMFRIPYHAILIFFFMYPWGLAKLLDPKFGGPVVARWGILAFPAAAGVVFLTLLPAIRKGAAYVVNNGTPWRWPWFPWFLFGILGFGVCGRCYWLGASFDPTRSLDMIVGGYCLAPFLVAIAVLTLEAGVVAGHRPTQIVAMCLPLLWLFLSLPDPHPSRVAAEFLATVIFTIGSPLFWMTIATILFYFYCCIRGVLDAWPCLAASLFLGSLIGPSTTNELSLAAPGAVPIFLYAAMQFWFAFRHGGSWRTLLAVTATLASLGIVFEGTWFTACYSAAPLHMFLAAVLVIGAVAKDRCARYLRLAGASGLVAGFLIVLTAHTRIVPEMPTWATNTYLTVAVLATIVYWQWVRDCTILFALAIQIFSGCIAFSWTLFDYARALHWPRGSRPLIIGFACFMLAILISASKAGFFRDPSLRRVRRRESASPPA